MINERLKTIRESLKLTQREFSSKINIGQSTLTQLENGQRSIKDIHISQVCSTFNVNENWFRNGEGDMFNAEISLDDFARMNNISELELDIIRVYMRLDQETRNKFISEMSKVFNKHNNSNL